MHGDGIKIIIGIHGDGIKIIIIGIHGVGIIKKLAFFLDRYSFRDNSE